MDRKTGARRTLTESFDRHVELVRVLARLEDRSTSPPRRRAAPTSSPSPRRADAVATVLGGGSFGDLSVLPDGKTLVGTQVALTHPAEIVRFGADGKGLARVTRINDALLASFSLRPGESVTYTGAAGKSVQAWLVKPPDFDPAKKYPLLVLVHGGPQGAWNDGWTYRWNAQVFASAGYVVFMPNPRGSTGWGQEFTDDINRDWGGRAFEDVMKGTDYAEALPYVERGRTAAAGASYGGYMINWIAGQTDRFKALVSHDGVFDLVSMYGSTEELWFPEWEFGGPYWANPEGYAPVQPPRLREELQDARPSSSTGRRTTACRSSRVSRCSPRCGGRASPRGSSSSPTRTTGS